MGLEGTQRVATECPPPTLIEIAVVRDLLVTMKNVTQDPGNEAIQGTGMQAGQEADAAGAPGLALLGIPEIMGTIIENTGTTENIGTGTTGITEITVATRATATTETAVAAIPGNAAREGAEVLGAMEEDSIAVEDLLRLQQMKPLATDELSRLRSSELETFFSQAGRVRAARIIEDRNTGRSKGVGYVEFYDEESVAKAIALTGQKLLGIPVIAKHTESEKNRLAQQAAAQAQDAANAAAQATPTDLSQHRLYVGSVNFDLTEDDLKQVLEPFGPIEFIKLHRDAETGKSKGFAFVQYKNAEDAKQAMERMNGYELAGRTIKVGLVTERGTTTQSNNINQYNNGQINNSIRIDDSDTVGYALTSQSRAELMQKLARGDASLGAVPPSTVAAAPASSAPTYVPPRQLPVVMPSRAVLLKNMFTDEDKSEPEWAKELEEDVKEEAEKNGPVVHIKVEQDSPGEIYLKFDSVQSATSAVQSLGGRFFAGRQIIAAFLPEMLYNVRFPSAANL
ncbi:hypothetical protein BGZ51_007330 [Haplosporangium sp. Z 767]|nr:hypothetical protein BGZ50_007971 [Haplosporangium sp. Z 11]KAF9178974.1 hypothetical protein BGZ51_007330 [Haplosporangium sp. Z 767]